MVDLPALPALPVGNDPIVCAVGNCVRQHVPRLISAKTVPYVTPGTDLWDMPHTLIHGTSVFNNRLLLERILLTHVYGNALVMPKASDASFESRDIKDVKLEYKSYPRHIEFELNSNMTVHEREAFIEMLYCFTESKSITGLPKNVIVLHGLTAIHNTHDYALRKLIEGVQSVAWILMDVETLSKVMDPIKSRCICVSSRMTFNPIVKELALATSKDVSTIELILSQQNSHDVIQVALRIQMPNGHLYTGHVRVWTEKRLCELQAAYLAALEPKANAKAITKYTALLRETTQNIMATGISVTTWFGFVVDIYGRKEHVNIHEIVELAAKKDALRVAKDGLILDSFIHELMFLL